ncbi:transporter [Streptomyces lincolnensis]|uniref:Transporter n=1 Tax=Streptomyces lincolnensis TaxID=1915 RepID=A0A1B1MMJ3_STRLN|nr:MFS transporter [Streptomyces lincolnensis]ANS69798.1 transporter [Streptomyces lincolnensis]AXG58716.1 transporter [Streptomyces lincolnensis]
MSQRPGWQLPLGLMLGAFIALLDVSIVTVALPDIGSDLNTGTSGMQWVVDAYTLPLSALLLAGGVLGDRCGRKRTYLTGIVVFTLASLGCALAPSVGALIAARAVQGAAAALVFTGTLSNLAQAYPEPRERARIIGLNGAVGGSAIVIGPLLGGVLVDSVGWRSIFLINLPVGLLILWLGARSLPETSDPDHAHLDLTGQVLALVLLGTLTYGLIESHAHGWASAHTVAPLFTAFAALVLFIWWERRSPRPMLPVRLFRDRGFTVPNVCSFVLGFGTSAVFFLLSLYLQQVQGRSAIQTGLRFLPLTLSICAVAPVASTLCAKFGAIRVMVVGYLVSAAGLAGLLLLDVDTGLGTLAVVSVVLGAGMGAAIGPTQLAGVAALPVRQSGLAAATISTTRQVGTALGVAVLGLIVATSAGAGPGTEGFADGFVRGLHISAAVTAASTLAAAVLLTPLARRTRPAVIPAHARQSADQSLGMKERREG